MPEELMEREIESEMPERLVPENGVSEDDETRRLREENERLRAEIERVKSLPMKERLYDHVHVSVRTLDIFICVLLVLGVAAVVMGMLR